ncbi:MAG: SWIM zinc finger domain-containing protein [Actinomycetota bacterium]|nr:SWIM zinc finger domain-containing protein [Actinomycetota bacterium]
MTAGDREAAGERPLGRWTVEHVAAVAPSADQFAAGDQAAEVRRWSDAGHAADVLWGTYRGGRAEPYDTWVDLGPLRREGIEPVSRCSCPSRKKPCKHALALLLLWVRHQVAECSDADVPAAVGTWASRHHGAMPASAGAGSDATAPARGSGTDVVTDGVIGGESPAVSPGPPHPLEPPGTSGRDDRVVRMAAGLGELDRWLHDRMRSGLSDPSLAEYATWDHLAARLVDAQAGALANRVRRMAGLVGTSPGWHGELLAEMGMLHLLARGGRTLATLPDPLADTLAMAIGWQVRQADVLAGVPESDVWDVIGRSDTREDRIVVRRTWLRGRASERLAMALSFAAYRQSLDVSMPVGGAFAADVHRYPGPSLRVLVGERQPDVAVDRAPAAGVDLAHACRLLGEALAAEPWAEHVALTVRAALTRDGGRWVLSDAHGALGCRAGPRALAAVLCETGGRPADMTVEWTPSGLLPLTVHLDDAVVDVGPLADLSFVEAA